MPQLVDERLQTQQRAVSAWGVAQCGHRHMAIAAMVAAMCAAVNVAERIYLAIVMTDRSVVVPNSLVMTSTVARP